MNAEQALQQIVSILQRAPISQLEAIGIEHALQVLREAIKKPEDAKP